MYQCPHCRQHSLYWVGDFDIEHESAYHSILQNFYCENCGSDVDVYVPREHPDKQLDLPLTEGNKNE